ncbi:Aste57867_15202 [Aphanomyces stellatus]|uniref:Aste57867_15202 protein n=1 Tax=Aphanomyces stellatus TaxID=120398 RepID=A0A485L4E7_9STRA|nr:hypothetical protein As57867_015146 [Aphanomyces stellatus]VFT92011.1 Aste57867_15202 [Aphanomyces stellatus]
MITDLMTETEQDIQRKLSYSAALPVSKPGDKVQIYVRLRPTTEDTGTFQILSDTCLVANPPRTSRVTESVSSFHFSQVFKPETNQRELFEQTAYPIIQEALEGKNGLVFAYGVTNSGKTYTILGNAEQPGILPETFETLFKKSENFQITASYLEIYNEKVYDLLAAGPRRTFLQLLEKDGCVYVKDLEERPIKSFEEAKLMLESGQKNRQIGETKCNTDSSRSHCVFSLQLYQNDKPDAVFSKISIVDLAGCERGAKTGASGLRLQEASKINGSLMNLNRCLETLRYNQLHPKSERPVPFRSSKLTRMFQESLAGKQAGRIIMIVAVNPSVEEFDETLRTLQYSAIAKEVVTAPSKVVSRRYAAPSSCRSRSRVMDDGGSPSILKMEYGTDGHKKRKRPSIAASRDILAPQKSPDVPAVRSRASIAKDRSSIANKPPSTSRTRVQKKAEQTTAIHSRTKPKTAAVAPVNGPAFKKRVTVPATVVEVLTRDDDVQEQEVMLLRTEVEQLKDELQAKEAEYVQQEIHVRRELVNELNKQLDGMKASYEAKLEELRGELETANQANEKLAQEKTYFEGLCEKLQEQIDECEDEIRRIEARHAEELQELQTF